MTVSEEYSISTHQFDLMCRGDDVLIDEAKRLLWRILLLRGSTGYPVAGVLTIKVSLEIPEETTDEEIPI